MRRFLVCLIAVVALAGCGDESRTPTDSLSMENPDGSLMASQARMWLWIENAENSYVGADPDPWYTDSYITYAQSFDVVLQNQATYDVDEVYLLVTVESAFLDVPGWTVSVDGIPLAPGDFTQTDTRAYGFDGGSHGVHQPSGTGVFYAYPMGGTLAGGGSWTVHVETTSGGVAGFRVHFDGGSSRIWTPPSHDVTAFPPEGSGEELEACCIESGGCQMLTASDCGELGTPQGPGSTCDPDPCVQEPPLGACCLPDLSCTVTTESDCESLGGSFVGPDTTCDPNPCIEVPPTGACCLADLSCIDTTAAACDSLSGLFGGDGTSCAVNGCAE
jgi:hypothetical protein